MEHAKGVKLNEVTVGWTAAPSSSVCRSEFICILHMLEEVQSLRGPFESSPVTVTHLSESGGTFIEARLTWVRLNAELKNCRKVGRESLAFLEKSSEEKKRQILKSAGTREWAIKMDTNQTVRRAKRKKKKGGERKTTADNRQRRREMGGLDMLMESDKRRMEQHERERKKAKADRWRLWHLGHYYIKRGLW